MPQELPPHPDETVFTWTSRELAAITRYGEACAALARREAIKEVVAKIKARHSHEVDAAARHAGRWQAAHESHMTRQAAVADVLNDIRALAPDTSKEG